MSEAMKKQIFCTFMISHTELAIDVRAVQEVVNYPEQIIKMPLSPSFLIGVFNLRNMIIPIVNLKSILKAQECDVNSGQKIAIVEFEGARVGLIFDSTHEIIRLDQETLADFHYSSKESKHVISGALKLDEGRRIIQVLNHSELFKIDNIPQILEQQAGGKQFNGRMGGRHQNLSKCITFSVAELKMCFEIAAIREIIRVPEISESLVQNKLCVGNVNLRGRTITVVDLAMLLGSRVERSEITEESRIIIFKVDKEYFGLLVDKVMSINTFAKDDVMSIPLIGNERAQMFTGCVTLGECGDVFLINDQGILTHHELRDISQGHARIYRQAEDQVDDNARKSEKKSYITFKLEHLFGIPIKDMREIIDYPKAVMAAPGAPNFVKGVCKLRGQLVTIIDTRVFYDMPKHDEGSAQKKVLIFDLNTERFGLVVDSLESILTVDSKTTHKVPSLLVQQVKDQFDQDINEVLTIDKNDAWNDVLFVLNISAICSRLTKSIAA